MVDHGASTNGHGMAHGWPWHDPQVIISWFKPWMVENGSTMAYTMVEHGCTMAAAWHDPWLAMARPVQVIMDRLWDDQWLTMDARRHVHGYTVA